MSSLLWAAVFFETCSDSECDPDVAVKQLEQMALHLQQLTPDEKQEFRAFAERIAADDARADVADQLRTVIHGLLPA